MTVVLWFAFLIALALIYQWLTGWVTRFSIFTVFFACLFIRFGIAIPFTDGITKSLVNITMPGPALASYHIALVIVYLTIAATLVFFKYLIPKPPRESEEKPANTSVLLVLLLGAVGIVGIVWIVLPWKQFIGGLGLFTSVTHTAAAFAEHRAEYSRITSSSSLVNYVGGFVRIGVLPALIWIGFFHARYRKLLLPTVGLALVLLFALGFATGQKQPELYLVVGGVIALMVRSNTVSIFNWRIGALAVVTLFGLIPALYHFQYPQLGYGALINQTMLRLVSEYSLTAQLRFYFYPSIHPFLYGASSLYVETALRIAGANTSGLTPPETYIPTAVLGSAFNIGSWNTGFFAEAWADFGFVGCFVESVLVAAILVAVDRWYASSSRGPITQGTYVALLVATTYLTDVALSTALWTYGFLPALILLWLLRRTSSLDLTRIRLAVTRRLAAAR